MKSKYDLIKLGFIIGVFLPVITIILVYFLRFGSYSLPSFLRTIMVLRTLPQFLSLAVLPNLLAFFIFIWLDHLFAARGVLGATIVDALIIVLIKFIL